MSKAAGGLRHRRSPDVMRLLAQARPASLDPGAAAPAEQVTAHLMAEGAPTADGTGPPGTSHTRRRAILTGTVLTVTACAAAVAVLVATAGSGAPPAGSMTPPAVITAAMVRQVATASRSALANSGRAVVAYRTTQNGAPQDSGTDTITFSGKDWNDAFSQTFPAAAGQPAHTQFAINRIVGGQFYLYIAGRTRRLQWYHDTNPSGHPSFTIPDPRTILRALEPSARFKLAGYQVIGGVRLKELRATSLRHMPSLGMLPDVDPGARPTSLEVWVDGHGVVHRIGLGFTVTTEVWSVKADNMRSKADGTMIITVPTKALAAALRAKLKKEHGHMVANGHRVIIHLAPPGSGAARHETQITALTVTFSGIGQPQRITAPRHAIQQYGQG
jgi:hypothetical protein